MDVAVPGFSLQVYAHLVESLDNLDERGHPLGLLPDVPALALVVDRRHVTMANRAAHHPHLLLLVFDEHLHLLQTSTSSPSTDARRRSGCLP